MEKVLLTGVSGFLGTHTTIQLLEKGYEVTGTLRDIKRAESIRQIIAAHTNKANNLRFAEADLSDTNIWEKLMPGITYVQHIASPFPRNLPKHEDELIIPAKNGVLAILRAAAKHDVKRVVLTSSSSAVLYGKPEGKQSGLFNEETWTDTSNTKDTTAYFRSKTIAEAAAWDFIKTNGKNLELATVLPGVILGPVLEEDFGTSANIVLKMLDGTMPALPNIGLDTVDVRSVADLLIKCMEMPEAANQRFLASAGFLSFQQIADILRTKYPDRKIPKRILPNWLTRVFALFETALKPILLDLGKQRRADNSKAKKMLHWQPIDNRDAALSCADSMIKLGLIK